MFYNTAIQNNFIYVEEFAGSTLFAMAEPEFAGVLKCWGNGAALQQSRSSILDKSDVKWLPFREYANCQTRAYALEKIMITATKMPAPSAKRLYFLCSVSA